MHNSSLLDALAELFEIIWASAVPLNQLSGPGPEVLADQDRDLLGLLAAGSTDELMARTFGWSVRTVQRHVRRIMNLLGVETRFQAGLESGRRGWLSRRLGLLSVRAGGVGVPEPLGVQLQQVRVRHWSLPGATSDRGLESPLLAASVPR